MSSVTKGRFGINAQYDSSGDVVRMNFKLNEDEDALEKDLVDKIWETYDKDGNGKLSMDEVECFLKDFYGSDEFKTIDSN